MSLETYEHLRRAPGHPGAPTLALLHGTGGNMRSFAELADMIAPEAGYLSLNGDVDEFGHKRFFRRRAEGVYDMEDLAARTQALGAFLEAAGAEYGVDPSALIGVGYSNGANILANLLLTRPGGVRRAALMHPLIPYTPKDAPRLEGTEVLITAGERDPICPPPMTEHLAALLRELGAQVQVSWRPGGHEIDRAELAEIARFVADAQRAAPGGAEAVGVRGATPA